MEASSALRPKETTAKTYPVDLPIILKLARLGCTEAQIAEFFDFSVSTLTRMKLAFPELVATLKEGKKWADAHVEDSLYRRALGYTLTETVTKFFHGIWHETKIERNHPPDTLACIFWLKNRKPNDWRDIHAVESRFVFEFVSRVGSTLNNLLPEVCPHCKGRLTLRESTIRELERLSKELEISRGAKS